MCYNIENGVILIDTNKCPGKRKRKLLFELEEKYKTKKFSKITRVDEQELSVQSADRATAVQFWSWAYVFTQ